MRLSARPLVNFANINSFDYANQWIVRAGDPNVLYFQIVDLDQGPASVIGAPNPVFGFQSTPVLSGNIGLRYIVGVGAINQPDGITVTFPSIDNVQVINLQAVQDPNDGSVWSVSIGQNQKPNSGNVTFAVQEGTAIRRFTVLNMINVEYPGADGQC